MQVADVLIDEFGRIREGVERVLGGLDEATLGARLDPDANSIAWLVWHLTRVQDDHVAAAFDVEQVWSTEGWVERFALPFPVADHGYGHTSEQVAALSGIGGELLLGFLELRLGGRLRLACRQHGEELLLHLKRDLVLL